jgi:hypothetical protein
MIDVLKSKRGAGEQRNGKRNTNHWGAPTAVASVLRALGGVCRQRRGHRARVHFEGIRGIG